MKILVIYRINEFSTKMIGVFIKLLGQLEAFDSIGCDAYALYMSRGEQRLAHFYNNSMHVMQSWDNSIRDKEFNIFWENSVSVVHSLKPDAVYARYEFMGEEPALTNFYRDVDIKDLVKCIEFATYPYENEIANKKKLKKDQENQRDLPLYLDLIYSASDEESILGMRNHAFSNQVSKSFLDNASTSSSPC